MSGAETSVWFEVCEVPDLSLNKYGGLGDSGIDGVLNAHSALLRQIHRLGKILKGTFHWYFQYDPARPRGSRMRIALRWTFANAVDPRDVAKILRASRLGQFFTFVPSLGGPGNTPPLTQADGYVFRAALRKKEKVSVSDGAGKSTYYSVNRWEPNSGGRLLAMFSLMRELDRPCLYRVSLAPLDLADTIEKPELLGNAMAFLRRVLTLRVEKSGTGVAMQRDEAADYTLRRYKELIEEVSENPHFLVNVAAYADDPVTAGTLLDAAAAESLTEGMHEISFGKGPFDLQQILTAGPTRDASTVAPRELTFWPNLFLLDEVSPFVRLPTLYDGETVEVRKETAPPRVAGGLVLGLDNDGLAVEFPLVNFPKHAFLCGVPGSGKTNTMMHLASTLHIDHKVPFLIIEPAKREYRALLNQPGMEDLTLFSPSSGTRFPLHINPFEFPRGIALAEHIRALDEVFAGAFAFEEASAVPFLLDGCIEDVYRAAGWHPKMRNDRKLPFPTMRELYSRFEQRLKETDYSPEIKGNITSFLQVRFGSLLTREMGDVFDVPASSLQPEQWLTRSIVIETEAMGEGPANFLSLLLSTLIRETLKASGPVPGRAAKPRHVIFYEEAHNLIGRSAESGTGGDTKAAATAFVVKMLAEVRALGEAIVIADQLPSTLAPEVVKNTSLKITHRLVDEEERGIVGAAMSANSVQMERMATFVTGQAIVGYEGLLRPFETRMSQWAGGRVSTVSPTDDAILAGVLNSHCPMQEMLRRSGDINLEKFGRIGEDLCVRLKTATRNAAQWQVRLSSAEEALRKLEVTMTNRVTLRLNLIEQSKSPEHAGSSREARKRVDDMIAQTQTEIAGLRAALSQQAEATNVYRSGLDKVRAKSRGIFSEVERFDTDVEFCAEQNPVRREDLRQFLTGHRARVKLLATACKDGGVWAEEPVSGEGK